MDLYTTITETLVEGKAENIVTLSTIKQSGGLFSQKIIVSGTSGRHVRALANRLLKALKPMGVKRSSVEISEDENWALVDCGDVIVHIMQEEARDYYHLESLWGFESSASS